jgi:GlpG protein
LWVRDEGQVERARQELAAFTANRTDPKYVAAAPLAKSIKKVESAREMQARRNVVDMRDHWRQPAFRQTPLVMLLIFLSVGVTLVTSFGQVTRQDDERRAALLQRLFIAETPPFGIPPTLAAVEQGEIWRLITPIFLHFSIMHVLFNMSGAYHFGVAIETIDGTWRFALLVVVIAVLSNLAQFYYPHIEQYLLRPPSAVDTRPAANFGGMSGVVFGLFGYVWMRARYDPLSRYSMDDQTVIMTLIWGALCVIGVIGHIANSAHAVGLLAGLAIGYGVSKWRIYRLRG